MKCFLYPDIGRVDEPLQLHMSGLKPFELVNISLSIKENTNMKMESSHAVKADENGKLKISQYDKGIENIFSKLIWNLQPTKPISIDYFINSLEQITFNIKIEATESNYIENRKIVRLFKEDYVSQVLLSSNIEGTYYYPKEKTGVPAVIVLRRNNEKGIVEAKAIASLLASHGYGALALNYVHKSGKDNQLGNIPIEKINHAIRWLMNHRATNKEKIILFGLEKGAELALLAASIVKDIHGVIAISPASHIFQGTSNKTRLSSWSKDGKSFPFIPFSPSISTTFKKWKSRFTKKTIPMSKIYEESLQKYLNKGKDEANIPAENIRGPILLLSPEHDQFWPSALMGKLIIDKLNKQSFPNEANQIIFPNVDELLLPPYLPSHSSGIVKWENAQAGEQGWQEIIAFLNKHFPTEKIVTETIPLTYT